MSQWEESNILYYNNNVEAFCQSVETASMQESCDGFLALLPPKPYILDLGCGTGRDSLYFLSQGCRVLPVDASEEMCKVAGARTGIEAKQLRFEQLDFEEEFDGIWACASLLHAQYGQLPLILQKICRALKSGGILYMSFKYGTGEKERSGRFFTDLTEADIPSLCNGETGLHMLNFSVSEDVRPDRKNERWLNILATKSCNA